MTQNYLQKEKFRVFIRKENFYEATDMVANCILNRFQQKDYIETLQTMEILLLKAFCEEVFGHELQQMSSFFSSDLDEFKLETQPKTLTHIVGEK